MGIANWHIETLQDSNLSSKSVSKFVSNKITLFSLSKFQFIRTAHSWYNIP